MGNKAFSTTEASTDFKARHELHITIRDGSRSVLLLLVHVKIWFSEPRNRQSNLNLTIIETLNVTLLVTAEGSPFNCGLILI